MIQGTQNTDHRIEQLALWTRLRRSKGLWLATLTLLAGAVFAYPSVTRWAGSERSIGENNTRGVWGACPQALLYSRWHWTHVRGKPLKSPP